MSPLSDPEDPEEREWADPTPTPEAERTTRYRVGGGLAVGFVVFRGTLLAVLPRIWPPGGPRWFTLVLVKGCRNDLPAVTDPARATAGKRLRQSVVMALSLTLPLMVGAALGGALARR